MRCDRFGNETYLAPKPLGDDAEVSLDLLGCLAIHAADSSARGRIARARVGNL